MRIVRDQEKMGTKMAILQGHIDMLALCRMQIYALLHRIAMSREPWRTVCNVRYIRVIITLVWSSQLHMFRGFYYTRMITVYKLDIEILIATFCFQNW